MQKRWGRWGTGALLLLLLLLLLIIYYIYSIKRTISFFFLPTKGAPVGAPLDFLVGHLEINIFPQKNKSAPVSQRCPSGALEWGTSTY